MNLETCIMTMLAIIYSSAMLLQLYKVLLNMNDDDDNNNDDDNNGGDDDVSLEQSFS